MACSLAGNTNLNILVIVVTKFAAFRDCIKGRLFIFRVFIVANYNVFNITFLALFEIIHPLEPFWQAEPLPTLRPARMLAQPLQVGIVVGIGN